MRSPSKSDTKHPVLEVIVSSLKDAVEAERGGASRLEIVRELDRGGLTPDLSMVRAIRETVNLPLHAMLRAQEDDSLPGDDRSLRIVAAELQKIGVDGVVIGFLCHGGADWVRVGHIIDAAPDLDVTFHHAFDETRCPLEAIDLLKECGRIDRILTSGGPGNIEERAVRLEHYRERIAGEMTLLAGGGLNEPELTYLRARTDISEFHVGRAARIPRENYGQVSAARVKRLHELLCGVSSSATPGGRVLE